MPRVARFVASGFGSGWAPVAPGTFGSLVGLVIGAVALTWWRPGVVVAAAVAAAVGVWAIAGCAAGDDPGWVVIDEIAGQLVALLPLARLSPAGLLAAFALFRLFDITKPGPIGWADRRHDAWGVMGDDLIAGAAAAAVLWLLIQAVPAIG